jgi:hypothetical protein
MIAFINYVPHRNSGTETNMLVMFREIAAACCVITGFRHEVDRSCALLGCYAAGSCNFIQTFRDSLSAMFREVAAACCVITGFRHEVNRNCVLLGYYPAGSGKSLPKFRGNLSVPTSPLKRGPRGCPETTVRNYHYPLGSNPEERSFHLLGGGSLK